MSFLRRSPRKHANPVEAITNTGPRRKSFMSRLFGPSPAVRQPREVSKRNRREPVFGRTSRGPFRSKKPQPVLDAITPNHKQRRPSLGDKIQGLGRRIGASLSGRPPQRSAGTRVATGTRRQGRRRFHF